MPAPSSSVSAKNWTWPPHHGPGQRSRTQSVGVGAGSWSRFLGARGINVLMTITLDAHAHDVRLALVADHHTVLRPLQLTDTADHLQLFPTPDAARAP